MVGSQLALAVVTRGGGWGGRSSFSRASSSATSRSSSVRRTNSSSRLSVVGTRAAIYDIVGPDCGQVIVTLDDKPPRIVPRFDAYCTYHRLQTMFIGSDLPDTVHTVKIEIHPEQPDKVKILSQRNQTMDKPERFNDTAYYPGAILLVGELVK